MKIKILLTIFVVSLFFGCQSSQTATSEKSSKPETAGSSKPANSASPKDAIISSMKNLQNAKFWTANVTSKVEEVPNSESKTEMEYSAPDSFRIESNSNGMQLEVVVIGNDSYMLANGKWQKMDASKANFGQMINNFKEMFKDEKVNAFTDVQAAGKESINGKEALVYTYKIDPLASMPAEMKEKMPEESKAMLAKSENSSKIWIDAEKNLPIKMEMTVKTSQPKEMTNKTVFEYNFDKEVKIEAPTVK